MYHERGPPRAGAVESPEDVDLALSHRERRFIVYELCQAGSLSLEELTDRLYEFDRISVGNRSRAAVRSALRRTHLPVLERAGIVDLAESTDLVSLKPTGSQAREIRRVAVARAQR